MATALDVMSSPVYVVGPDDTVSRARMTMLRRGVSRLPVVEDDEPVGMVTKVDLAWGTAQREPPRKRRPVESLRVSRIMSGEPVTAEPGDSLGDLAGKMLENSISGLPVVEDEEERFGDAGSLLGMVTKHDLTSHLAEIGPRLDVADVCTRDVATVHRHRSVNHVVGEMLDRGVHRLVVVEASDAPVGIITRSDLAFSDLGGTAGLRGKDVKMARKAEKGGEKRLRSVVKVNLVAEDVMSEDLITVGPEKSAGDAADVMIGEGVGGLPVLEGDELVGIVTKTDLVRALAGEA